MDCPKCGSSNAAIRGHDQRRTSTYRKLKCKDCGKITNVLLYNITDSDLGEIEKKPRYVITSAVNAAKVHKPFLAALETYCVAHDAQLLIIPLRYRNPTSPAENNAENACSWYAPAVRPYLYSKRESLTDGLRIMGDIKTQPTAARPLSGMDSITGSDCGIFGHTKISMDSIPTRADEIPKLLYTTGAVTRPDYSDTKAGKKGEFHHTMGAVVVELDNDLFHIRHLLPNNSGSFYDLDKVYTPQGVQAGKPVAALVAGDLHAEKADPQNLEATFIGKGSISDTLKPQRIVLHDALNFGSGSHHNGFFEKFRRHHNGTACIRTELAETYGLMDTIAKKAKEVIVVDSNHDNHFMQWLEVDKNANDPANAQLFAETRAAVLPELINKGYCNPFELWARTQMKAYRKTTFLKPNESYTVHGIELGFHGDKGLNGARGSAAGLAKIGAKTIIGHSHSPKIHDGCSQTGTSSLLNMGYNSGGASSWLHSHVVVYPNGKRTHIHVIDGRWRS